LNEDEDKDKVVFNDEYDKVVLMALMIR